MIVWTKIKDRWVLEWAMPDRSQIILLWDCPCSEGHAEWECPA